MVGGASAATIERREYKFLIDDALVDRLREAIAPFCAIDPYARVDGAYRIDSLYFDTPGLTAFYATAHEQLDRFKVRIRSYPDSPQAAAAVFFEIKRRRNDVITKTRGRVAGPWWTLLDGTAASDHPALSDPAVERFVAIALTHHFRPLVIVRYLREPWASVVDDYARVTFDRHVRCHQMERLSLAPSAAGWLAIDDPRSMRSGRSLTILELKFTSHVPLWMSHLVRSHDLYRRAFSKYGAAVRALDALPSARTPHPNRVARVAP